MARVLIVDDVEEIGRALARVLRHEGHEALAATSGSGALDALRREHVDVALIDLGLPDDGLALLDRLRVELPDIAVIAMSGSPAGLQEAASRGYARQLLKPFTFEVMLEMIAEAAGAAARRDRSGPG